MTIPDMIVAVQRKLGLVPDGEAGPKTWAGIYKTIVGAPPVIIPKCSDIIDSRSERNILTLVPEVRTLAKQLIDLSAKAGIQIRIIDGTRTYKEQDELYAQGRTKPGKIVTNSRAGFSWHNFGVAFDFGVFEGNEYIDDSHDYVIVGQIGKSLGFEWGGDWISPVDRPHLHLNPKKLTLAQAREITSQGGKLV